MLQFVNAAVERQKLRILCTRVFASVCICMYVWVVSNAVNTNTAKIRNVHIYEYTREYVHPFDVPHAPLLILYGKVFIW